MHWRTLCEVKEKYLWTWGTCLTTRPSSRCLSQHPCWWRIMLSHLTTDVSRALTGATAKSAKVNFNPSLNQMKDYFHRQNPMWNDLLWGTRQQSRPGIIDRRWRSQARRRIWIDLLCARCRHKGPVCSSCREMGTIPTPALLCDRLWLYVVDILVRPDAWCRRLAAILNLASRWHMHVSHPT